MSTNAMVKTFFDDSSNTYTHLIVDPATKQAAVIDSVLDYDPKAGRTSTVTADDVVNYVKAEGLSVEWILETHIHADHLSAAPYLKLQLGGKTGIGSVVDQVQKTFKTIFNVEQGFRTDGSQFDVQFANGDVFKLGDLAVRVMHTPGHTPACVTYVVDNALAFVGDTLFMPDQGTARCDFPGGDATQLYQSVRSILSMPDNTKLYMCHDYGPNGRDYKYLTTVKEQREQNIHVNDAIPVDSFVQMRTERDATLGMPMLILPAVQINIRAGELPPPEANGTAYIKVPLNML